MFTENDIRGQTDSVIKAYTLATGHDMSSITMTDFLHVRNAAIAELQMGLGKTMDVPDLPERAVYGTSQDTTVSDAVPPTKPAFQPHASVIPISTRVEGNTGSENVATTALPETIDEYAILKSVKDEWN
jgi:hypothetical protein